MSMMTVTYIGGPTAVLDYAGLRILIDPTFDPPQDYDSDGDLLRKTAGPALQVSELGEITLVLLSHHEHEDNLDHAGRALLNHIPVTLSTAKAGTDLGRPVVGLDCWETHRVGTVTITAVPALHGPPGIEPFVGPVIGFVLEATDEPTVYVSGDNASLDLVRHIAERFPAIDIAVLFAGAARVPSIDASLTLSAGEAVEAAQILGVSHVIAVHTEDWGHFTESRADLDAAFADTGLLVDTPRGQRVHVEVESPRSARVELAG